MKYIFTLSGNSERFTKEGFIIKPLIKIDGKLIIEYVLDMFPNINFKDCIFITNDHDVKTHNIDVVLKQLYSESTVITIPAHKKGPVVSILKIENIIMDNEPYIVSYCDLTHKWDFEDFVKNINQSKCDGCLVTHTGMHPHRMININFAHLRINDSNVLEVKEKGYFTDNPINEYASSGIYYFKNGSLLKKYCKKLIENNDTINGEFYITLVYNEMIKDGLFISHYPTDNYVCFGTPFELISFMYWKSISNTTLTNTDINFIKKYWSNYHVTN